MTWIRELTSSPAVEPSAPEHPQAPEQITPRTNSTTDVLLGVIASMTEATSVDSALTRLAELALEATSAERCVILARTPSGDMFAPAAAATKIGDPPILWKQFSTMAPIGFSEMSARQLLLGPNDVRTFEDVSASSIIPHKWRQVFGSQSLAIAPLRIGSEALGVIAFDYATQRHTFTQEEVDLFRSISSAASLALREAQLLQDVRRGAEMERRLADCTAVLLSNRTLGEVIETIADAFAPLLPECSFSISLLESNRTSFRQILSRNNLMPSVPSVSIQASDTDTTEALSPNDGDLARVLERWEHDPLKPLTIDDAAKCPKWAAVLPEESNGAIVLPLANDGLVVGWIAAGRPGPAFSPEEIAVARSFAAHAALAVTQATLREAGRLREEVIRSLSHLSDRAGQMSNPRALLKTLNKDLTGGLGMKCTRLAFSAQLASTLRMPELSDHERALVKAWKSDRSPVTEGSLLAVPIVIGRRPSGIIWLTAREPESVAIPIATAIASAIGDVVWKARSRQNSEKRSVELALAKDRERIARALHDTVGQLFYSIGLRLHDAANNTKDNSLKEKLWDIRGQASAGMSEVRAAVYAQSFLRTNRSGLASSIRELTSRFSRATGIPIETHVGERLGGVSPDVGKALTRVLHESLVNMERHARATSATVSLTKKAGLLSLEITDDGVGLMHRDGLDWRGSAHFGMRSMQRSIQELGGTFSAGPNTPCGLRVHASVSARASSDK